MKPLVIVTGASSGIGAAIAKIFSDHGYALGLFARNQAAMEKLNLPDTICQSVDITDIFALKHAVNAAESRFGPSEGLINNAGYVKGGDFLDVSHEDHKNTMNVNLMGVMNGFEAVLPGMRERKKGTIINISSLADRKARPHIASYAATKAAVKSLTESLRVANAKYGIRICNLAPAKIKTPMLMSLSLDQKSTISAEDLAMTALWMYQQPQHICIRDLVFAPTSYEP